MKTLAYRDHRKKKKKGNWDKFRDQIKEDFINTRENIKDTFQEIKEHFEEDTSIKNNLNKQNNQNNRNIQNFKKKKRKKIDANLELFCPFCEYPIPKELKPLISDSDSIVCENCGTEIKKNSFFKEYSFPN